MLGAMIGDIVGSKYEFNNTFDYNFEMFGGDVTLLMTPFVRWR